MRVPGSVNVEHDPWIGISSLSLRLVRTRSLYPDNDEGPHAAAPRSSVEIALYATSRSFWASASDCSFFSDWFSIWRIRSRVTLNVRPTSSSVRGCSPPSP